MVKSIDIQSNSLRYIYTVVRTTTSLTHAAYRNPGATRLRLISVHVYLLNALKYGPDSTGGEGVSQVEIVRLDATMGC